MNFIWIGDGFYLESGTLMSPIYFEDGQRACWNDVEQVLREGGSVYIRRASDAERIPYLKQLVKIRLDRTSRRAAETQKVSKSTEGDENAPV